MRVCRCAFPSFLYAFVPAILLLVASAAYGQASYTAQVRGIVKDQSGAMITNAMVTITNDATGIITTAHSDANGLYILTGLRPAVYTIKLNETDFGRQSKEMSCCRSINRPRSTLSCIPWE